MGDRFHPKLNILRKPIAKKYCEGKVKRTLKRELKVLEIVKGEADRNGIIPLWGITVGSLKRSMYLFLCWYHYILGTKTSV